MALAVLLFTTNPQRLPIVLLPLPFVLIGAALFMSVSMFVRRFWPRVARRKRLFYAAVIAGVPTFLLVLGSINQLTWRDAVLLAVLLVSLTFYASRANFD